MTTTAPERKQQDAAGTIAWAVRQAGYTLPVRVRAWDGSESGPSGTPVLVLRSPQALRRLLWKPGELGLARAYVSGDLDVEGDLTEGLRLFWGMVRGTKPGWSPSRLADTATAAALAARRLGVFGSPPPPPDCELHMSGRLHSRARDRAVIAGHYDQPPAFFQLILDPAMAYSCGYWSDDPGATLADAQRAKLDLVCRKLGLGSGRTLLDVGCGWGSLTVHAAEYYQASVTAVTLSAEQGGYTRARLNGLGLADRAQVLVQDYRDAPEGPFDAISSLEMGEHVGAANYPMFCAALRDRLKPGGKVLIQQMSRSGHAPGGGAFIEAYVTADMHMRPVGETVALLEQAGLEVLGVEAMRTHYTRTIRAWLDNLEEHFTEAEQLLGAERARMWRLYLAGGALAFEEGRMGVDQILAARRE